MNGAILLIIDDEASVCRALRRILQKRVQEVITVSNAADAELVLDTRPVTHVLCDNLLGAEQPRGMDIAAGWKKKHPSIVRLAILTGASASCGSLPDGIDVVLPKTTDPFALADLIGL